MFSSEVNFGNKDISNFWPYNLSLSQQPALVWCRFTPRHCERPKSQQESKTQLIQNLWLQVFHSTR